MNWKAIATLGFFGGAGLSGAQRGVLFASWGLLDTPIVISGKWFAFILDDDNIMNLYL